MITAHDVVAEARAWLGVPFLHQGRSRNGVDCIGYVAAVCAHLGALEPLNNLPHNYARNPQALLKDALRMLGRPTTLEIGCIVLIKWPLTKDPSHVGIYTGESMIHCYEAVGRVVEHGYTTPWPERTESLWRLPGVTY